MHIPWAKKSYVCVAELSDTNGQGWVALVGISLLGPTSDERFVNQANEPKSKSNSHKLYTRP